MKFNSSMFKEFVRSTNNKITHYYYVEKFKNKNIQQKELWKKETPKPYSNEKIKVEKIGTFVITKDKIKFVKGV